MKAVLAAAVLAVFFATTSLPETPKPAQGAEAESAGSGLQWRCNAVREFEPYCKAIEAEVEGVEPSARAPATVISHEAGTKIELDFSGAAILGHDMANLLLAADGLLPRHIGSIVIRNVLLKGRVELNSTDFRRALTLDQVRLADATGECSNRDGEQQSSNGIGIIGSRFHKQIYLSQVSGCGNIEIISSRFDHGLLFNNDKMANSNSIGAIIINQSHVERELFIYKWSVENIEIALSRFDAVILRKLQVDGGFIFRDSELYSLGIFQLGSPLGVSLRSNYIRDSVRLSDLYIGRSVVEVDRKGLYFADNEVEGRLVISLRAEPKGSPLVHVNLAADKTAELALHHNRIGGSTDIFIEEGLNSTIDLRGSKFASELLLTRACVADVQQDGAATPTSCQRRCGFGPRDSGFCAVDPTVPSASEYVAKLDVQLTAVEVDTLVWNLRDEAVRWSGPGLRYTYWDPEPRRGQRPYQPQAVAGVEENGSATEGGGDRPNPMQAWLDQLEHGPDAVDPLTYGAAYFKAHGQVAEAAETRLQALESNLRNKILSDPLGPAKLGNALFYVALAPVGWGARPEWAIPLMAILVLFFWGLYVLHSRRSASNWPAGDQWHAWKLEISDLHPPDAVNEMIAAIANGRGGGVAVLPPPQFASIASGALEGHERPFQALLSIAPRDPPAFSQIPGFNQYNNTFPPRQFSLFLFSLDAMLPVISLHHFDRYYPTNIDESFKQTPYQWVRWLSIGQHGIGWWLSTVFVASLFV